MKTLTYPWRCIDRSGQLCRWLDNDPVWAPGGVPIWDRREAEAWAENINGRAVPWPIVGNA